MLNKISTVVFILFVVTVFAYANMAKAAIVKDGLVSYWTFDKAHIDGNTVKDAVGNNHGTFKGDSIKIVEGKVGNALEFDGVVDFVEVPDSQSLRMDNAGTIEMWINPTEIRDYDGIFIKAADWGGLDMF